MIPSAVTPWLTALSAYSATSQNITPQSIAISEHAGSIYSPICTSFPLHTVSTRICCRSNLDVTYLGEKVVSEKEYLSAILTDALEIYGIWQSEEVVLGLI